MDISIINTDGLEDFEKTDSVLRSLIAAIGGTIPGARGFGLSGNAADFMPEAARNEFLMELDEKVEEYLPEIVIEDAAFEDVGEGRTVLRLSVAENEEDEE